jgi:hypothetical protein
MLPDFSYLTRTPSNLPSKFNTHYLGHKKCIAPPGTKEEIDAIFEQNSYKNLKDGYIFQSEDKKWFVKGERRSNGGAQILTTPDTHLYRVRKSIKVQNYIKKNHLEGSLAVPEKYLYWDSKLGKFFTVARSMDLSNEVAELFDSNQHFDSSAGGQVKALMMKSPTRAITPIQAKALAELSFKGLTDYSYNNLFFTKAGQVAILDTEPVKRAATKFSYNISNHWFKGSMNYLFGNYSTWKLTNAIAGTAKLKFVCPNPEALKEVERVEKKHVLWHISKLITKIALVSLAFYALPSAIALLSLTGVAVTLISVTAKTLLAFKLISLLINGVVSALFVWKASLPNNLNTIVQLELQGLI